jgi:RNA polymerase sigma factor (TIGR02999 family)
METQATITRLLGELQAGNDAALEELFTLLYDELHTLARRQRERWHGDYTLNTTALVHEAYLKLAGSAPPRLDDRAHFAAVASRVMRHILCNHARAGGTQKRGGGNPVLTLDDSAPDLQAAQASDDADLLVALDEALHRLEQEDARMSRVVECRFFGGMTIEETAAAIGASPRTVKRDWAVAQAWLHREIGSQT